MKEYHTNAKGKKPLYCIDLFAGCGGLSLGLEEAGFTTLLFSELNSTAAETYIANREGKEIIPVGDVYSLTDANIEILKLYWRYTKGVSDIDLVCGGPPCRGFSGIGHRRTFKLEKKDMPSNHLFQEMARIVKCVKPKMFLFENVRGLINSKWDSSGKNGEVFRDVLNEFKAIDGYSVRWELVHAKDYGVPQNRPRVLIVGIRCDILNPATQMLLLEEGNETVSVDNPSAVKYGFLPKPGGTPPTLVELLSDLVDPEYLGKSATNQYVSDPENELQKK